MTKKKTPSVSAKTIKIACEAKACLPLSSLQDFQGNLKSRTPQQLQQIQTSIEKYGFSFPFFVWKQGKKNWCLDGHGRMAALQQMQAEGWTVPALPIAYIQAKDRADHPKPQTKPMTVREAFNGISDRGDSPDMSKNYHCSWHQARPGECVGSRQDTEKLCLDRPAKTLTKSEGYGGTYHPTEPRPISTLERKRIASFPDTFIFTDWKNAVLRIGNSVPPNLMRAIALHIKTKILRMSE